MMKKLTGALIILALTTISVSEALAECAWVVWIQSRLVSTFEGRIDDEISWEAHSAFEKRAQCVDKQEHVWKAAAKDAEATSFFKNLRKEFPDKLDAERPNGSWMKKFYCLPDTVDPRSKAIGTKQ